MRGRPGVPYFYGRNWDAFWDAVTGLVRIPEPSAFRRLGLAPGTRTERWGSAPAATGRLPRPVAVLSCLSTTWSRVGLVRGLWGIRCSVRTAWAASVLLSSGTDLAWMSWASGAKDSFGMACQDRQVSLAGGVHADEVAAVPLGDGTWVWRWGHRASRSTPLVRCAGAVG
ncbi:barstar family protein [Streptomyces melanogenes]|uniref:barstar family protein n=1 Tax=Streptomyces melanogenes TaxID=67326 RepID=UPI0037AB6A09